MGGLFGCLYGLVFRSAAGGARRDFAPTTHIEAARYDVEVDEDIAQEAERLLGAMPAAR
jgi:hypothetical protein